MNKTSLQDLKKYIASADPRIIIVVFDATKATEVKKAVAPYKAHLVLYCKISETKTFVTSRDPRGLVPISPLLAIFDPATDNVYAAAKKGVSDFELIRTIFTPRG